MGWALAQTKGGAREDKLIAAHPTEARHAARDVALELARGCIEESCTSRQGRNSSLFSCVKKKKDTLH